MTKYLTDLSQLDAVKSISPWKDRFYITLAQTSSGARGDSRKIYITGRELVLEPYKGPSSP